MGNLQTTTAYSVEVIFEDLLATELRCLSTADKAIFKAAVQLLMI